LKARPIQRFSTERSSPAQDISCGAKSGKHGALQLWLPTIAAHHGRVLERTFGSNRVGDLVDLSGERLGAGQPEDVIDAVVLAEGHRLGAGIVAVAPAGKARSSRSPIVSP
jgi:hypothetical protein